LSLALDEARDLVTLGEQIKSAAAEQLASAHPENAEIHTVNQTEFTGPIETRDGVKTSKNAVVVSPGRLDRSPCGTGTSARLAVLHARGEVTVGERFRHLSILDTVFECRVVDTTQVGTSRRSFPRLAVERGSPAYRITASIRKIHFPGDIAWLTPGSSDACS